MGVQAGVTPLTTTHSDPMGDFVLFVSTTLSFGELEVLIPKESVLFPGDIAMVPLNYKLWLPPGHFGHLVSKGTSLERKIHHIGKGS